MELKERYKKIAESDWFKEQYSDNESLEIDELTKDLLAEIESLRKQVEELENEIKRKDETIRAVAGFIAASNPNRTCSYEDIIDYVLAKEDK